MLVILIRVVCREEDAVNRNRLIYPFLTTQLNLLTVFLAPLLPNPLLTIFNNQVHCLNRTMYADHFDQFDIRR